MTKQHPLTDEEIRNFAQPEYGYFESDSILGVSECSLGYDSDDLRAAADWQLEQVLYWLRTTQWYLAPSTMADLLEKAMRPQQQEESNND